MCAYVKCTPNHHAFRALTLLLQIPALISRESFIKAAGTSRLSTQNDVLDPKTTGLKASIMRTPEVQVVRNQAAPTPGPWLQAFAGHGHRSRTPGAD